MAESAGPWDTTNWGEDPWQRAGRLWAPSCVAAGKLNQLSLAANGGMTALLNTGVAWVEGFGYQNDSTKLLTFADATATAGTSRRDLVVLRLDRTNKLITAEIKTGTFATTPVDPALTQTDTLFEHPLHRVNVAANASTIGTITDLRNLYRPGRGIIYDAVGPGTQVDSTSENGIMSTTVRMIGGHKYRITASLNGSQITNPGAPKARILVNGVMPNGGYIIYTQSNLGTPPTGVTGSISVVYTAGSTTDVTVQITGQSNAAAFRIPANSASLTIEDIG